MPTVEAKERPKVVLPRSPSEVSKKWVDQTFLMLGSPKIGKSEFWSHGKDTLYIQTEPGLNHLAVQKLPVSCWGDLQDVYTALLTASQGGQYPYDTVVIDTGDRFVDFATEEIIEQVRAKFKDKDINNLFDYPGAGKFGNPAWGMRTTLIDNAMAKLSLLPSALVVVCHLDIKEVNHVDKHTISIGGATGKRILAWADHIMSIQSSVQGTVVKRKVISRPSSTSDGGSRGNMIPADYAWGADARMNYATLRGFFT